LRATGADLGLADPAASPYTLPQGNKERHVSGPTPDTQDSRAPIENKAQLIEALASGSKSKDQWRIGTEHEKFPFLTDTLRPVHYEGERSIRSLLEGLRDRFGWQGVYENDNIIALNDPDDLGNISLEPGGQFELSGAPLANVHETCEEVHEHLVQVREIGDALGIGFLGLGASPTWTRAETPVMPKGRYGIMAPYMDKVGSMGRDMMFRTCTVQTNLDFGSEADMVKKLRVSLALQPIATALFANSPFLEGRPNGYLSFRSHVWTDTDNNRSGMLPFAFEDGMSFERYVDYALDVPMYFVMREGKFINTAGESFRKFLAGHLPQLPGDKPILKDWNDHLTTIFPEVRLKKYLEMRGADSGPWRRLCALPAFWVGILYEQTALDAAWDLVKDWTAEERQALRNAVPAKALQATIRNRTVAAIAADALKIARAGLDARNATGCKGRTEAQFLDVLDETVATGKTAAENLLDLYHDGWKGDVNRVFRDFAY
jgi:glutamate--cysteine ligase